MLSERKRKKKEERREAGCELTTNLGTRTQKNCERQVGYILITKS
jgi:hypothetical protein